MQFTLRLLVAAFLLHDASRVAADIGGGAVPITGAPPRPATPGPNGWETYTPATFPNSVSDPELCQMLGESFLCDPNNILKEGNVTANHESLSHSINQIRQNTKCACGPDDENLGTCQGEGGFVVSIALVEKMELDANQENKIDRMQAASTFANLLRDRQNRAQCDDDILIFMSKTDAVMWTAVGKVAERYLTAELINAITLNAETFFVNKEYTKGLNYTLDKYGQVLRGEQVDLTPPTGWYWPFPLWAVITIGVVVLLVVLALIGLSIWGCTRCCCTEKDQYTMGQRL